MEDKRILIRKKMAWPARVCSRNAILPATIVDLSSAGARVVLAEATVLANQCYLNASLFANDIRCRVVWQTGTEIGLLFLKARDASRIRLPRLDGPPP